MTSNFPRFQSPPPTILVIQSKAKTFKIGSRFFLYLFFYRSNKKHADVEILIEQKKTVNCLPHFRGPPAAAGIEKAVIDNLPSFLYNALICNSLGSSFFSLFLLVFATIFDRRATVRLQLIDGGVKVQS